MYAILWQIGPRVSADSIYLQVAGDAREARGACKRTPCSSPLYSGHTLRAARAIDLLVTDEAASLRELGLEVTLA